MMLARGQIVDVRVSSWAEIYPVLQGQIRRMLRRGAGDTTTEGDLRRSWRIIGVEIDGGIVGCGFFEIYERPRGRCLYCTGIAGFGVERWQEAMDACCDQLAAEFGCYSVETKARPASAAFLKTKGWRQTAIVMEKRYGR
jgi:hypothetical protein